jgi:hypothetical protein
MMRCSGCGADGQVTGVLTVRYPSQAKHGPGSVERGRETTGSLLSEALSWLIVMAVGLAPMLV